MLKSMIKALPQINTLKQIEAYKYIQFTSSAQPRAVVLASILPIQLCQSHSPSLNSQIQHILYFGQTAGQSHLPCSAGRFWSVYGCGVGFLQILLN